MNTGEARSIAARWVAELASRSAGEVLGVFTGGSINGRADAEPFPTSSDVDLLIVVPQKDPERHRLEKHAFEGIAIESAYRPCDRFFSAADVLGDWALAEQLVHGAILFDPSGELAALRAEVAARFAERSWVRRRLDALRDEALHLLALAETSPRLLFVVGVLMHVVRNLGQLVLVAALRNPTGKRALVEAHGVLRSHGLAEEHETMLRLLGAGERDDAAVLAAAARCGHAVDAACAHKRTAFAADGQVSVHARRALELEVPALVAAGCGREMLPWIVSLHSFAMTALEKDAPAEVVGAAWPAYLQELARLGLGTLDQARVRAAACRGAVAHVRDVCEAIVARPAREGEEV